MVIVAAGSASGWNQAGGRQWERRAPAAFRGGLEPFQLALALSPDLVPAHKVLGLCCIHLGNVDEALDHFDKEDLASQPPAGPIPRRR